MKIDVILRFSTSPGQQVKMRVGLSGIDTNDPHDLVSMSYLDKQHWHVQLNFTPMQLSSNGTLRYKYIFEDEGGTIAEDWWKNRSISLRDCTSAFLLLDTWLDMGSVDNLGYTSPFQDVFFADRRFERPSLLKEGITRFTVNAPMLPPFMQLGMLGNAHALGEWEVDKPLVMHYNGKGWFADLDSSAVKLTFDYKYCLLNAEGKFAGYEHGENRVFQPTLLPLGSCLVQDGYARINHDWKGAGIAIPVFSLRTFQSMGVGDFCDIKLLVDWASGVSVKMIQLLPVHDTTSTHTKFDSYPYAAISAFALHPIYASIESVAGQTHAGLIKPHLDQKDQLNRSEGVDYEAVMQLKWGALGVLYRAMKDEVFQEPDYGEFFSTNKSWLVPYAAFSYLRDVFGSSDPSNWDRFAAFDAEMIKELCSPGSSAFDDIALHYFIQYQLHLQLKAAHDHANHKGIILKGDIAIGVHKHGADTWRQPSLYHLDMQAGAPPDLFATKGQNWGFPTYNWEAMKSDGFAWWKHRFKHMSQYFDAFRIDHILGFFRIWSIPLEAVEGIMGHFVPAIPVSRTEFEHKAVQFKERRFCEPFINDAVILELAGTMEEEVRYFLRKDGASTYRFKPGFDTQHKIEQYFMEHGWINSKASLKQVLFDLHSNVLLWHDREQKDGFHFRFNVQHTLSFKHLDHLTQIQLLDLYNDYFFVRQEGIWEKEAMDKLPVLKRCTDMLICGEDLGLLPQSVPKVLASLGFLSMEVQRMPKQGLASFFDPINATYLSVVTPSTHDMSTIREWWLEDSNMAQQFFNEQLGQHGHAPAHANTQIVRSIVLQHLASPAMWAVFQLQDLFAMNDQLRLDDPFAERINIPADPKHYWRFRMHINIEALIKMDTFNDELKYLISANRR